MFVFYTSCFITLIVAIFNIWYDIKYAILTVNKKAVENFQIVFVLFVLETVVFFVKCKIWPSVFGKNNYFIELISKNVLLKNDC